MNIFSTVFSTLFMVLGAFIWIVAMLIVLIGAIGLLKVTVREVFHADLLEWYRARRP